MQIGLSWSITGAVMQNSNSLILVYGWGNFRETDLTQHGLCVDMCTKN